MRRNQGGFTFIEVLVVMGIIGVLAGLTVVAMNLIVRRQPEIKTESRVKKVSMVIAQWHGRFQYYPPTNPTKLKARAGGKDPLPSMPNRTNVPIETLYQALYWPTFLSDPKLTDDEIGNTDEDEFDKATAQGKIIYEVIDAWGNPLIYFEHTDYAKADRDPPTYTLGADYDFEEVAVRPWKYKDEARGFAEPRSFQLFSMGPDGIPNNEDDVKSWE